MARLPCSHFGSIGFSHGALTGSPHTRILQPPSCLARRLCSPIQRLTRFTRPVNYLGLPALAIPSGFSRSGLPIAMQLIGRSFDEATLLTVGAAFQRATDFHARVPKIG